MLKTFLNICTTKPMGKGPYCDLFTKGAQHVKKELAFLADAFARGGGSNLPPLRNASFFLKKNIYIYSSIFSLEPKFFFFQNYPFQAFLVSHTFFLIFLPHKNLYLILPCSMNMSASQKNGPLAEIKCFQDLLKKFRILQFSY